MMEGDNMQVASVCYDWVVVGAGPAGMFTVATLLDRGQDPRKIAWIDPFFQVGDLGRYWGKVSANTRNQLFLDFLRSRKSFHYEAIEPDCLFAQQDLDGHSLLGVLVQPLQQITAHLVRQVAHFYDTVTRVSPSTAGWSVHTAKDTVQARKVVLAIGSEAKVFDYSGYEVVSLVDALDPERLAAKIGETDQVAVFGSSHSAVLVLHNVLQTKVKKVINFYRDPLCYAQHTPAGIVHDNTGLKGFAATWARAQLESVQDKRLQRLKSTKMALDKHLPCCHKIIYAVGFSRRTLCVEGVDVQGYCRTQGVLAPGLFGCGIAFPEEKLDLSGALEEQVGLAKFQAYLQRVIPQWQAQ
jgi:thioredoxin reductase